MSSVDPHRIVELEAIPVRYPTVGRFKFFEGPDGKPLGRPAVLVKITTESDHVGWGQSVPVPKWSYETVESVVTTLRQYLGPELVGHAADDLEGAHRIMNQCIAGSFSTGMPLAKAGVDLALNDLTGRISACSLAQLWKKKSRESIELSWTLNPLDIDQVDALVDEGKRRGYRHFNVKVAPDARFDLELCSRVKKLVPEGFLWADANGGYDLVTALEVAPKLADIGVAVLEQPLRANRLNGYREMKSQGALPIIMDEGVVSPTDLAEFFQLGLLDGVAMKPARCGGLLSARQQIEFLQEHGLMFLGSGLTDPDVSLAASLALYAAYDYDLPAALNGPQFLASSVLKEPLVAEEGRLAVPGGSGLGIEVDEAKLDSIRIEV